jgi:hypothetical protein
MGTWSDKLDVCRLRFRRREVPERLGPEGITVPPAPSAGYTQTGTARFMIVF